MSTTSASAAPTAVRDPLEIMKEAQAAAGSIASQVAFLDADLKAFAEVATRIQQRASIMPDDFVGKAMLHGAAVSAIQLPAMLGMAVSQYKPG